MFLIWGDRLGLGGRMPRRFKSSNCFPANNVNWLLSTRTIIDLRSYSTKSKELAVQEPTEAKLRERQRYLCYMHPITRGSGTRKD
jgi:hypothetical protein